MTKDTKTSLTPENIKQAAKLANQEQREVMEKKKTGWEKEFYQKFKNPKNTGYRVGQEFLGAVEDFIRQTIQAEREQVVKEERERILKALPNYLV